MLSSVVSSVVNGVIGKPALSPSISMLDFSSDIADLVNRRRLHRTVVSTCSPEIKFIIQFMPFRVGLLLRSGGSLEACEYVSWDRDNDIRR